MKNFWWGRYPKSVPPAGTLSRVKIFGFHRLYNLDFFRRGSERDDALLLVTVRGNPQLWHGPKPMYPRRGSVTLYLVGEDHRFKAKVWEAYWVHFYPSQALLAILAQYGITTGRTFDTALTDREIEELAEIFAYPEDPEPLAFHRCAVLAERTILRCLTDPPERRKAPSHMRLEDVANLIAADPATHYSVASLARIAHLSPSRLMHLFKEEYGKSIRDFRTDLRIERAKHLLTNTTMTAAQIGAQLGYRNPYHFYSVFRKAAGFPPREYRRSASGRTM